MNLSGSLVLRNSATKMFLRALGISVSPFTELEQFKLACEQANPRFQGGRDLVRFQLEKDDRTWPEEVKDATINLAGFLNMCRGETTLTGKYDMIIALGGARRSPLHRACYAAQALVDLRAETKILIVAGSERQLGEEEKALVQDYAPNAKTEWDLCLGAAGKVHDRYPEILLDVIGEQDPKAGNDRVIDTVMNFYNANASGNGWPAQASVAIVTTRIYTFGLHLDMARAAKRHNWRNFLAAGHSTDPEMVFNRTITTYLSECLTTLRKAAIAAAEGC